MDIMQKPEVTRILKENDIIAKVKMENGRPRVDCKDNPGFFKAQILFKNYLVSVTYGLYY